MSLDALDVAVLTALANDATLATLAPGGVWKDIAPAGAVDAALEDPSQVFGIVTVQSATDQHALGESDETPSMEEVRYLVKFVSPSSSGLGAEAALTRAVAVLRTLAATGYAITASRREERVNYVEADGDVRWQHRGVSWLVAASKVTS